MKVNSCNTSNYHGFSVKFSPNLPELIACAASENYGVAGKGCLYIIAQSIEDGYLPTLRYDWQVGLYNVSWSNHSPNVIAASSADGAVLLWNTLDNSLPPTVLRGHDREVHGLDWSPRNSPELILSSGVDGTVVMWDVNSGNVLDSYDEHRGVVYDAVWCPHMLGVFASAGADGKLMLRDTRSPELLPQVLSAQGGDVFCCDWSILNSNVMASGGTDCAINIWDLRYSEVPVSTLSGHETAVRRVKFTPFHRSVLASVSYDLSTRFWDVLTTRPRKTYKYHTEFVTGLDFSPLIFDKMADCGWDSKVKLYEDIDFGVLL